MPYTRHSYFHHWSTPATSPSPWAQESFFDGMRSAYNPCKRLAPAQSARFTDPTFKYYAKSVKKDLVSLQTWADEIIQLRRKCDDLYEQAKAAHMKGEYDRAERKLGELKKMLKAIDGEWKRFGLNGSAREVKVCLG